MAQLPFGGQKSPYKHGHIKELLGLRPCLRERSPNHIALGGCIMAEVRLTAKTGVSLTNVFHRKACQASVQGYEQEDQMWKGEIYGKR